MSNLTLKVQPRKRVGRSLKALRAQGILPAVVYGCDFQAAPVQVALKDFKKIYQQAGESSLVELDLEGEKFPVLFHEVVIDPLTEQAIHADFYKVDLRKKITTDVPLRFEGESPAVKNAAGILIKNLQAVKVESFPGNLPAQLTVDLTSLRSFGDGVLIKDLSLPEGVIVKEDPQAIVVLVQEPISEAELEKELAVTVAGGAEEVEVIKKEGKEGEKEEEKTITAAEKKEQAN